MGRFAAVTTQVDIGGVGPDHRNRLYLVESEGEQVLIVLQQHDDLFGGLLAKTAVLGAAGDSFGVVGVHIGVVEQAQAELGGEHARDGAVHFAERHGTLLHLPKEGSKHGAIGEVVIDRKSTRLNSSHL